MLSKSQLDKLGSRLRNSDPPAAEDVAMLREYLLAHQAPLEEARAHVQALGYNATPRLKTADTTLEKLRREHMRLSAIQDIAGLRLDAVESRTVQDEAVTRLCGEFEQSKVVDRRDRPSHGYRAVHVIATVEGRLVEIQVRTKLQDLWAQTMEALADRWGRQIRYGEVPDDPGRPFRNTTRAGIVALLVHVSQLIDDLARPGYLPPELAAGVERDWRATLSGLRSIADEA